jgi:hypothetical protein
MQVGFLLFGSAQTANDCSFRPIEGRTLQTPRPAGSRSSSSVLLRQNIDLVKLWAVHTQSRGRRQPDLGLVPPRAPHRPHQLPCHRAEEISASVDTPVAAPITRRPRAAEARSGPTARACARGLCLPFPRRAARRGSHELGRGARRRGARLAAATVAGASRRAAARVCATQRCPGRGHPHRVGLPGTGPLGHAIRMTGARRPPCAGYSRRAAAGRVVHATAWAAGRPHAARSEVGSRRPRLRPLPPDPLPPLRRPLLPHQNVRTPNELEPEQVMR